MEPQRLGSAAGGSIIGALIGVLVSIWWLDSTPVGTTVAKRRPLGTGCQGRFSEPPPGEGSGLGFGARHAELPQLQQPVAPPDRLWRHLLEAGEVVRCERSFRLGCVDQIVTRDQLGAEAARELLQSA